MTFSIAAHDGEAWGVAVASRFLAVGSVVPRVVPGRCALATQAMARVAYLDEVEDGLLEGLTAAAALERATAGDAGREDRQVGVVGADGAATFTGSGCMHWAGGEAAGDSQTAFAVQGNILTGPEVVEAMVSAWHAHRGHALDARLLAVLLAGDAAGGDARGRQSAALLVKAPGAGYDGCGVVADLRVDDHPEAPTELARVHGLSTLYFGTAEDVEPLTGPLRDEVSRLLAAAGHAGPVEPALEAWMGEVNLETRHSPGAIDRRVLAVLRGSPTG
ncbi:DUF1028 domain-containing protein [Phycicoccus sp.]|uniref:DUF1028 domain-containing protein n=1 Tax=Phycicoccus sp. TaxID=1902410 RepID=UPI002CAEB0A8|nr:DUF1028 domain-containing protein [Phycicoccus sp.]HMM94794.1 DUF1028 domain-containing protein [Phycicoccus sp.]